MDSKDAVPVESNSNEARTNDTMLELNVTRGKYGIHIRALKWTTVFLVIVMMSAALGITNFFDGASKLPEHIPTSYLRTNTSELPTLNNSIGNETFRQRPSPELFHK